MIFNKRDLVRPAQFFVQNLLVTLHSVNPPTANGFPVATLINWLPDSDHFHSCSSDPVNDHSSSLGGKSQVIQQLRDVKAYLSAPAWRTVPVRTSSGSQKKPHISDLMTYAGPEPAASGL